MSLRGKRRNLITGAIFIVGGIVLFLSALTIPPGGQLGMGGAFMPKTMSVLLIICGGAFLITALTAKQIPSSNDVKTPEQKTAEKRQRIMFILEFGLLFLYLLFLKSVGFIIMTLLFIFLQAWLITPPENHKPIVTAVIAIVSTLLTYVIFVKGFQLILPAGILG